MSLGSLFVSESVSTFFGFYSVRRMDVNRVGWSNGVMDYCATRDSEAEARNYLLTLTYSANAARQSRIGGRPSCSDNKQRSGVLRGRAAMRLISDSFTL